MPDKDEDKRVRLNMWLDQNIYEKYRDMCKAEGRSVSDVTRQIINDYIKETERRILEFKKKR